MMTINEVITKHFFQLKALAKPSDIPVYNGNMIEDIFQSCFITAIKKFKNKDVDENIALEYLKRTILNEIKFSYRRKAKDRLLFVENIIVYDKSDENDGE